jgi:hypothetical protein
MKLSLIRKDFTERSTIGDLFIDGKWFCYTLEDVVRDGEKVSGQTAIPYGEYEVITNWSNRFKKIMPLLLNVPGFEGIRIHPGNTDKDTEGCILLGSSKAVDVVGGSKKAFDLFFIRLQDGLKNGKVRLEITSEQV